MWVRFKRVTVPDSPIVAWEVTRDGVTYGQIRVSRTMLTFVPDQRCHNIGWQGFRAIYDQMLRLSDSSDPLNEVLEDLWT
jgi:hypothetical protein